MPTRYDLEMPIWRGDTTVIPFLLMSGADPVPLDGATVVFTIKLDPTVDDDVADFIYSSEVPVGDPDGVAGQHMVRIERSDLAGLPLTAYTYQLKAIFPGSPEPLEITYLWGRVQLKDS